MDAARLTMSDILDFLLEQEKARRTNEGSGEERAEAALRALLNTLEEPSGPKAAVCRSTLMHASSRKSRDFEGECDRLYNRAALMHAHILLKSSNIAIRLGMARDPEMKDAMFVEIARLLVEAIIPVLDSLPDPGDRLAAWIEMVARTRPYHAVAVNEEARSGTTLYEDMRGSLAIIGLVMQARRLRASGHADEAWLNLIDASCLAGAQKGVSFYRDISSAVEVKRRDIAGGKAKHGGTNKLKRRARELYMACRPPSGWTDYKEAGNVVHPHIVEAAKSLSQQFVAEGKKAVVLGKKTVFEVCREMYQLEMMGELAPWTSSQPDPSKG